MSTLAERKLRAYENFRSWLILLASKHSMREISIRAGVDHSAVSRFVHSEREPMLDTARALIDAWVQ